MKMNGQTVSGPNIAYAVIPRHYGDLVFKAQAILDMEEFKKLVPEPLPGKKMLPGGKVVEDRDDKAFRSSVGRYADLRYAFIFLKSLSATEGIEWETIKLSEPDTWLNWEKELKDSGLSEPEIVQIQMAVAEANGLSQAKMDEARDRFLASLAEVQPKS